MVLGEAVRFAVLGVAIGLPVELMATRLIRSHVFGVGSLDAISIGAAIIALTITALIASYLPAWRASRVGPLEALRHE